MTFRVMLVDRAGDGLALLARAAGEAGLVELRLDHVASVHEAVGRLVEEPTDVVFVGTPTDEGNREEAILRLVCTAPDCSVLPLPLSAWGGGEPQRDLALLVRTLGRLYRQRVDRRRLVHWATHDRLTGLANRWLFEDKLADAIARARRNGTTGALLFLDLDGFKAINDCFGHEAGDAVLRTTAERLRGSLRACDTVARFGGDEFVVLLDSVSSLLTAQAVADKLRRRIAEPIALPHGTIAISCSLGMSLFPVEGEDPPLLLRQADRLMYRHKSGRRAVFAA